MRNVAGAHLARATHGVPPASRTPLPMTDARLSRATHLAEIALLLTIAADLSDLPGSDRSLIEAALEAARDALPAAD